MALRGLNELIDHNTIAVKQLITKSAGRESSGYIVFSHNKKLMHRKLYFMSYNNRFDTCLYIMYKNIKYAINLPLKSRTNIITSTEQLRG